MSNMNLVTGYKGEAHVTAADVGSFQAAMMGSGSYVLNRGSKLAATIPSSNSVRIADGDILQQGRHIRLAEGTYVDLVIDSGEQGKRRNDLIVCRYTRNTTTGVEEANLVVIKGTAASGTPSDPAYTQGNIITDHATTADMPLYRVKLNGITITGTEALFTYAPDWSSAISAYATVTYVNTQISTVSAQVSTLSGKVEPDFSTSEQSTGKKWIDNRTIYKKTYSATNISPSGGYYTIGQLTGFSEIVRIDGVMYYDGNYIAVIPAISSGGSIGVSDDVATGTIPKWTATIYYTKN